MANETTPTPTVPPSQQAQNVPPGNHTNSQTQSLDKAMVELQRRERALREQEAKYKDAVSLSSLQERAKTDRNGLLKELGLLDLVQSDPNDPVAELKKQLQDMQNAQKAREEQEARQKMFESFQSQFKEKASDFELTSQLGREKDVFEYLQSNRTESGDLPDWTEAARQLEDMILADLSKLKGSKKVMELFAPAPAPKHPLDNRATMTSSDTPATAPRDSANPAPSRFHQLDQLKQHLKFS